MTTPRPARRELLLALALAAAVVAVFGLAFWAPFIYDDRVYILENPEVVGPWRGWARWISSPLFDHGEYEPIVSLIHRLLYQVFGESVPAFRLSNLALHLAAALGFFALARRLLGSAPHAFAAAALFGLYPGHAEIMAIATFKKHLLVALCGLGLLGLELGRIKAVPRLAAQAALFALALLVKESAMILPAILAAAPLAGLSPRRPRAERYGLAGLCALIAAGYAAWRAAVAPRLWPALSQDLLSHLASSVKCLLWYLRELAAPLSLCQEHNVSPARAAFSGEGLLLGLGLACVAAAGARLWRRDRLLGFSAAWTVLALAPFLNLVPFLSVSLVANRYLYMASAGFFLGLSRASQLWGSRWARPLAAAAIALGLFYARQACAQLARYSDPLELWTSAAACAPENPRAHIGLGAVLKERGRRDEAAAHFRRALELLPDGYGRWGALQLAMLEADAGRYEEARRLAELGEGALPSVAHGIIGLALMRQGRFAEARPRLEYALKFAPHLADTRVLLGQCLYQLGDRATAEALWREALLMPATRLKAACLLGELLLENGRPQPAAEAFALALERDPRAIEAAEGLAHALQKLGRRAEAAAALDRLVDETERQLDRARAQDAGGWRLQLEAARAARRRFLKGSPRARG